MVSQFSQPDHDADGAGLYKDKIDPSIAVVARLGDWFAAHESDPQAMTVDLDAGWILAGLTLTEKAVQTTATIIAPTTDPRIDRVVIDDTTGTVSVITGTEAASPTPPAITAGKLPVAQVALVVSQTQILNADITDERAWPLQVAAEFPTGGTVRILFEMTTPPTGWTKETGAAYNNNALRITTGTIGSAGADDFDTVFGASIDTDAHTLVDGEMPSHSGHFDSRNTNEFQASMSGGIATTSMTHSSRGSDNSHFHGMTMDLKYHDVVIASKD